MKRPRRRCTLGSLVLTEILIIGMNVGQLVSISFAISKVLLHSPASFRNLPTPLWGTPSDEDPMNALYWVLGILDSVLLLLAAERSGTLSCKNMPLQSKCQKRAIAIKMSSQREGRLASGGRRMIGYVSMSRAVASASWNYYFALI